MATGRLTRVLEATARTKGVTLYADAADVAAIDVLAKTEVGNKKLAREMKRMSTPAFTAKYGI